MKLNVLFEDEGVCRIVDDVGHERSRFKTVYEQGFNSQYPPPLSPDQRALYVGSWRGGLYCYDVETGRLQWRHGPGKVRRIFPFDGGVVVEVFERGLFSRTQETGELNFEMGMKSIDYVQLVAPDRLFAGPYRNEYFLYEFPDLRPIGVIRHDEINVGDFLSCKVSDVQLAGDELLISGWQTYPPDDYYRPNAGGEFTRRLRPTPVASARR